MEVQLERVNAAIGAAIRECAAMVNIPVLYKFRSLSRQIQQFGIGPGDL
jgi:hypothetical protein